jgi:peptide/nickel transport system substrate-binding protein
MARRIIRLLAISITVFVLVMAFSGTNFVAASEKKGAEAPQYGGELTIRQGISPPGWDPAKTIWSVERFVLMSYEKPLRGGIDEYGPRGKNLFHYRYNDNSPMDYAVPHLVERWEVPEPTRIIFHVRKGIRFQNKPPVNGRELDAHDVALSLKRIWEVPRFKTGYWKWVKNIEAKDKYTVEFTLNQYNSPWKWFLGYGWYADIVPRELVEQKLINKWEYVCGTGPFILNKYTPDVSVTYKRNPDYWDTTSVGGKKYKLPFVDKVTFVIIKDDPTYLAALRTGKLDLTHLAGPYQVKPIIEKNADLKYVTTSRITANVIHMRCDRAPTNDVRVRRALQLALNNKDMLDRLYFGDGDVMFHPMNTKGFPQYIPPEEFPPHLKELAGHNLEKAKKLLAEAGYPNGFEIELMTASWAINQDQAAACEGYWKDIGVTTKIKSVEPGVLYGTFYRGKQPQMLLVGRGGMHLMEAQAHGRIESVWDISRWDDPVFIKYLEAGLAATDPAVRDENIKKMNLRFLEELPEILFPASTGYTVWWPWIKNYYGEFDVGYEYVGPTYARIWVDQKLKKKMGK